ncbi:dihydrodipicolinate synthase family protein [Subtercola sp. Z020]|uniref:DUF993 family protein n=1 Tax=Subtercola sp. Z020 TaxID=2080582 RepID=UPI000CE82624|nr:DUF993 family protein [Subtercola sp. Z020]PPF77513.1 dihydrodipicolinate synthase family protein [Subtercola sp. Z020]
MTCKITLPTTEGRGESLVLRAPEHLDVPGRPVRSRAAFAASHVVADPLRAAQSVRHDHIDWDTTLELRHRIWDTGLGVAESMDTAQRGMGLAADDALELARRTMEADPRGGAGVVVGIATDAIQTQTASLMQIGDAYLSQLEFVESRGGTAVVMASRQLVQAARTTEDYLSVYQRVLDASGGTIILHWLGEVFDPTLAGYWGQPTPAAALQTVVDLIEANTSKVAGIKISLLDPAYELELRRRLPEGVLLFTGDDYNYVDMIAGDGARHSHALLGAFAALAPFASAALARLDVGDVDGFRSILEPTQALSRLVFANPTPFYKVGIAWIAYLSGFQNHFRMLGGLESGRTLLHLADIVREADRIGLFPDPEVTAFRATRFFEMHGVV